MLDILNDSSSQDQIVESFRFFPQLHILLATHPNLNPVAITTGVGPNGRETMHFRSSAANQPSVPDSVIDPALLTISNTSQIPPAPVLHAPAEGQENSNPQPASTPARPSSSTVVQPLMTQTPKQGPKPSTFGSTKLDTAIAKANIKPVSKKRSWEDAFASMQKYVTMFASILLI
jgi:hypothetical protein